MPLHKFHCKHCGKYKEFKDGRNKTYRFCSVECSASHMKTTRFCWDLADEEEKKAKVLQNFYKNIKIKNGCWAYKKKCSGFGYPLVEIEKRKTTTLHRLSYEIHHGKIPKGMIVRHLCNNPSCVRPSHLAIGTQQDNMDDKVKAGNQCKGSTHGMSKLTKKQAKEIKKLLIEEKMTYKEIGEKFYVSKGCITNIARGITWVHVEVEGFKKTKGKILNGEDNGFSKLTEQNVKEIKNMLSKGERLCEISKKYKVNSTTISRIRDGKTWSHVIIDT